MAVAVFFLLSGMFAAELALIGLAPAGPVGAGLFVACALVLGLRVRNRQPAAQHARSAQDAPRPTRAPVAVR